jgi:hypothetical protein
LVQLYKIIFRQAARASSGDTLSPRQKMSLKARSSFKLTAISAAP